MRLFVVAVAIALASPVGLSREARAQQADLPPAAGGPAIRRPARPVPPQPYAKVYYVQDLVEVRVPESLDSALDRVGETIQRDVPATRGGLSWFVTNMGIVASLRGHEHVELAEYLKKARQARYALNMKTP